MKAARYKVPGQPLVVEDVPELKLRPGSAVVRVLAAFVAPYFHEMLESVQPYGMPPLPFTPGMDTIGIIEQVAADVRGLEAGQRVFCDHYYNTTNLVSKAESCYIGVFGKGDNSKAIMAEWPDGGFAEKLILPAECFTPLGAAASVEPAILVRLGWIGTCYGGYIRAGFRPGMRVVVNAATGLMGSAGLVLALAMGAARVVAVGRKPRVLEELTALDPRRVIAVPADSPDAAAEIRRACGGADIMLDAVGDITDPTSTSNALAALAPYGTAILAGGVNAPLNVNTKWILDNQVRILGSSWFPRAAMAELLAMIGSGALDMGVFRAQSWPLSKVNEAIALAAKGPGGLEHLALTP
ncbi:MAG: zinc-binding dehydrogenase [Alphaproteobacteria bacterium]